MPVPGREQSELSCCTVGEFHAVKMLIGLQVFAVQIEVASDMTDMTFLEELHSEPKDLLSTIAAAARPAPYKWMDAHGTPGTK